MSVEFCRFGIYTPILNYVCFCKQFIRLKLFRILSSAEVFFLYVGIIY